ncbi:hypothetical protein [Bacillus smithii]
MGKEQNGFLTTFLSWMFAMNEYGYVSAVDEHGFQQVGFFV